ncbi:MAG: DNA polymerase III subunit gamma/tau [Edaphobacter sp.]|uniref:DNA polymerase III subunit gamma/tau n=1 Tax=Edaphobacter sp. TaxID=1934404 RepID=UPI002398B5EE|nr:DNA polymerase III subunit gamma/tau [Edaphobacter sp.]MDE1175124.1 DNA polymerase III subunit gamma/tau [Edaphobacter sp.]
MAYQVLARKYRPQRFADVAGQDHVTVTLMNALTQGRIAHGYIFSGHRGIGKTTIARILAMALNCRNTIGSEARPTAEPCEVCESCTEIRSGTAVDVIEIDAATNRGIDEIRELRDAARYRPARDRYKIYILDEAHQITDAAFNALLKTLEEPPDHIVFMMATTQPEDIPQTVRSRCQHFSFHAVKLVDILAQIRAIADHEGVEADDAALALLAEAGDGSMRDALSIMDQAIASAPVEDGKPRLDAAQIRELMGTVPSAVFERVLEAVDANRSADVITIANELLDAGNSPAQLARQCVRYLRNCLIAKIAGIGADGTGLDGNTTELLQISSDEQRRAGRSASLFTEEELTRFLQVMLRTFDELGYRQEQRFHFELGLLKLVHLRRLLPVEEILSRFPTSGSSGSGAEAPRTRTAATAPQSTPRPAPVPSVAPSAPAKPAFSPFGGDSSRRVVPAPPQPAAPKPVSETPKIVREPAKQSAPVAVLEPEEPKGVSALEIATDLVGMGAISVPDPEVYVAPAVEDPTPPPPVAPTQESAGQSADDLQRTVVEALSSAKSQGSAADAMGDAEWLIEGGEIRVQTNLSKTMLSMVINPDADRIIRATLRTVGTGSLKLTLLPGAAGASSAPKKAKAARSGSAQAKALDHPVVQQAQRLFNAEIRNVIDLSDND